MKLLYAIKSCLHDLDRGFHDVIRNTWGRDITEGTLRFFVGGPERTTLFSDEVQLDCPDGYHDLPHKTRTIFSWAIKQQYDFCWLGDTDTFLIPRKLMDSDFQNYDYMGVNSRPWGVPFDYTSRDRNGTERFHAGCYPWASGGYGITISRKAMELVVAVEPTFWAEDMQIGQILNPAYNRGEIKIGTFIMGQVSQHFPQGRFNSGYDLKFGWQEEMQRLHGVNN